MSDFHSFAKRLREKAKAFDKEGNELAITAANALIRELVFRTPVDKSTALSNWVVGIGKAKINPISAHVLGSKGSTRFQSAEKAIIDAYSVLKNKKRGQKIYISNSIDYIVPLNTNGTRSVSPGFVEASIEVAKRAVQNRIKLSKV